jgi:hypothetical protein
MEVRMLAEIEARVVRAWRSTAAGVAVLLGLVVLHLLGPDAIRELAGEVDALAALLTSLTGLGGLVPGAVALWAVLWKEKAA